MAGNRKKNLIINTSGSWTGKDITLDSTESAKLELHGDISYKGKNIEDWMDDKILEMIGFLFGEKKAKKYEEYLKGKELIKNIEKK